MGGGVKTSITSNGSLMDEKMALKILNSGLERVNFSIDGLDKKDYEKIRVGLSFEEVLGNALQFIKLRDKLNSKVAVRISVIKSSFTLKSIDKIIAFWEKLLDKDKGDSLKIDDLSLGITDKSKDKGLEQMQYERQKIFDEANKTPCYALWHTMVIKCDGQVALCCVDQCRNVVLGDLNTQSIAEVWQSKILKQARVLQLEKGRGAMKICKNCLCWF